MTSSSSPQSNNQPIGYGQFSYANLGGLTYSFTVADPSIMVEEEEALQGTVGLHFKSPDQPAFTVLAHDNEDGTFLLYTLQPERSITTYEWYTIMQLISSEEQVPGMVNIPTFISDNNLGRHFTVEQVDATHTVLAALLQPQESA
jgi:hypothetical protein